MDVLVTCLNYPYPLENGENLRIYHYVRTLRSRHNFDLICLGDGEPPAQLKQLFRRIDHVQAPRETAESASLLDRIGASFSLDHFCPPIPALRAALEKALAAREYDLVWTSADIFPSLPCDRKQPVLGDIVDDLVVQ
ncbi:MAG TPA: hypothetical protein VFA81_11785, partial [Burkholderiales bacterium]|nr:hypothetical protein [Burkholderiales bacterium]